MSGLKAAQSTCLVIGWKLRGGGKEGSQQSPGAVARIGWKGAVQGAPMLRDGAEGREELSDGGSTPAQPLPPRAPHLCASCRCLDSSYIVSSPCFLPQLP